MNYKSMIVAVALMFVSAFAFAEAPAGGSSTASRLSVEPYTDFVISRDVKTNGVKSTIKDMNWYGVKANVKVTDALTVSPFVAYVDNKDEKGKSFTLGSEDQYGYGVDGKYAFNTGLPVDVALTGGYRSADTKQDVSSFQYKEWYVEPQISKTVEIAGVPGKFTPVFGVRYSDLRNGDTKANDNVGITVGSSYAINDNLSINVDGKFIDQTALELGAKVSW